MKFLKFAIGLILGLLLIVLPISQFQRSPIESLQTLAVQLDGRKKPLDIVARETVTQIHGRDRYRQENGETLDYLQTYFSLLFNDRDWNPEKFILCNYRPLKERIGLNPEAKYFSFQDLLNSQLALVIIEARQKQANNVDLSREEREALLVEERLDLMLHTVGKTPPIVPHPTDIKGTWVSLSEAQQYYTHEQISPLLARYELLQQAYQSHSFNLNLVSQVASSLRQDFIQLSPSVYPKDKVLQREVFYRGFHPFGKAWKLYGLAFAILGLGMAFQSKEEGRSQKPNRNENGSLSMLSDGESARQFSSFFLSLSSDWYWTALGIFGAGLFVQGYGFLLRMQISGRPPVTNMYESVVWVGFGIAAFALIFELIFQAKYYLLVAAPLASLCLLVADSLPAVLDASIQPLVPVLRDNFWLSVHVPTITLSYASFALAMGLGHVILGHYIFTPKSDRIQGLSKLNYRVLQVGVLLLTTGVILGGIWAHFAWGRFWGWDPKETWALIALLCYLVPLHGRLVGWMGNFGMAVTSVVSFNGVLMAWYGVNFVLGKGLHSYGFSTGGSEAIVAGAIAIDLLFVLAAWAKYTSFTQSVNLDINGRIPVNEPSQ